MSNKTFHISQAVLDSTLLAASCTGSEGCHISGGPMRGARAGGADDPPRLVQQLQLNSAFRVGLVSNLATSRVFFLFPRVTKSTPTFCTHGIVSRRTCPKVGRRPPCPWALKISPERMCTTREPALPAPLPAPASPRSSINPRRPLCLSLPSSLSLLLAPSFPPSSRFAGQKSDVLTSSPR